MSINKGKDPIVDSLLKEYLRTYMWLGGMPEVVSTWLLGQDAMACQAVQQRIITAYLDDFPKYAKHHQIEHVDKVFKDLPLQLGKKFKFSHIDPEIRANSLKVALNLLQKAGVAYKCHHTSGQNPPLMAAMNEKFFKAFLLDIGLAQRLMQLEHTDWIMQALNVENLGEITEQFVAQELIAYLSHDTKAEIFYWHREAKSSMAEIDFLISQRGRLLPIEVKSGKTGRLKSLHLYLESHQNAAYGTNRKYVSQAIQVNENFVLVDVFDFYPGSGGQAAERRTWWAISHVRWIETCVSILRHPPERTHKNPQCFWHAGFGGLRRCAPNPPYNQQLVSGGVWLL